MLSTVCILALSQLIFLSCENDINEVNRLFSKSETQVETALGVELLYSDSAILELRIVTPKMLRHFQEKDPFQEFPDGLQIEFFDDAGEEVTARMTARYAERYENSNKFIVRDSVVWRSQNQEQLETEELIWEEEEDRVHTNKFVVVRRSDEIIYGHGFDSNKDFTRWKIRAIEGRIKSSGLTKELKD
jgi:LPS export ABC transporter protein LptC